MKRCIILALLCLTLALLLPAALRRSWDRPVAPVPVPAEAAADAPAAAEEPVPLSPDERVSFTLLTGEGSRQITMAEYLPGVLAGEMPAAFESEALRAQAVASRSYALYQLQRGGAHGAGTVCADPSCCQLWLGEEALGERWGEGYEGWWGRVCQAVEDTDGQYLRYEGEPLLACFHSSSAGRTESCGVLWGMSLPYLVSVPSPEGEQDVPNYVSTVELSPEEFRESIYAALPEADLTGLPPDWVGERALDSSGRVAAIRVGGRAVPGTRMRSLFGLRSTCFMLEWTGRSFLFTVTGYGHGAGMSQYGAQVMAEQGSTYRDILTHYYPGSELFVP